MRDGLPRQAELSGVLTRARDLGFLGPGPVQAHVEQARVFADVLAAERVGADHAESVPEESGVDLGSGAGTPGLILALDPRLASWRWVLVEAMAKRASFLTAAIEHLDLVDRAQVMHGRAEELARNPHLRYRSSVVVARSFGAPPVVAECAVGFLIRGGRLLVSEPPGQGSAVDRGRWPKEGLELLGLTAEKAVRRLGGGVVQLRRTGADDDRYPRRTGVPRKRPSF